MENQLPEFPYHDDQNKVMALLGYTGVGKTSLIAAGYFENVMHGKDAFTQRFFQRIEDEICEYGTIPLTLGEASTLYFIEPQSRIEFTIQDFSGEHIKLERKDKKEYQDLLARADSSHALVCMLSASNFYRNTQIYEEVDAMQTFVNELRGLGTRIPVVIVLSKCDNVPRFFIDLPVLKAISCWMARLPWLRLSPSRALEVTRRRFPSIFSSFQFKGKGPRPIFMGIAIPRLRQLKPWQWPRGLRWLARVLRRMLIEPKWLFQRNYQLQEPFAFCFQAFQLGILRNLLVQNHQDNDYCQELLQKFSRVMIDENGYGVEFYFKEYFDRILEDTRSLIEEMEEEIAQLSQTAQRLLAHERDLGQNLRVWLENGETSLCKFNKPWSRGARKTLEQLRYDTMTSVKERLQELITQALEESGPTSFYRVVDILRLRQEIGELPIWAQEQISLPEVDVFQKRLLDHLIQLTLSRIEVPTALFYEDRNKYLEVLTITPPAELTMLEKLVDAAAQLQKNIGQYEAGSGQWGERILELLHNFEQQWSQLASKFELEHSCNFRENLERKVLASLEQEAGEFKNLANLLLWVTEAEQLIHCRQSRQKLQEIGDVAAQHSRDLLDKELQEIKVRGERWRGSGELLPTRIKEWFAETERRRDYLHQISGNKGIEALEKLQKEVLEQVADYLRDNIKDALQERDRAVFIELLQTLHVYNDVEKLDIFSRYGVSLPATEELEKSLFNYLVISSLGRSGISETLYQEERSRFLTAVRGSAPPYLRPLDNLVQAFDQLQKGAKEMPSRPTTDWESRILEPMRVFHQSWLDLAGRLSLPEEPHVRKEAERAAVRSLQEQLRNLDLNRLRDWSGMLYPLLQIDANRSLLDKLQRDTENEIRTHFQQDLQQFIDRCRELVDAADRLSRKQHQQAQTTWQQFAGSVRALAYSAEKFPRAELSFDEKTSGIFEEEAPHKLQQALEKWEQAVASHKLADQNQCQQMLQTISQVRVIFGRPQGFTDISERLEGQLAKIQKRRSYLRRGQLALAAVALIILGLFSLRYHLGSQAEQIKAFASENFDQHQQIAERWQRLRSYPSWLLPDEVVRHAGEQLILHRQLAALEQMHTQITSRKLEVQAIANLMKKLTTLLAGKPVAMVEDKAQQIFLDLRASRLLQLLEKKQGNEVVIQESAELAALEKRLQQRNPFFKSQLLEEVKILLSKKKEAGKK